MTSDQPWWLTMSPAEVAPTILPLFSSRAHQDERSAFYSALNWCKTGSISSKGRGSLTSAPFEDPDSGAIAEAIQVLEHAGLLLRTFGVDLTFIGLTRLGWYALETKTVRQHLGLGDTPPTR
jgi:hypothetical protein